MKTTKNFFFMAAGAALLAGCFAHREAPEREVTAKGLDEAKGLAESVQRVDLSGQKQGDVPDALASMPKLKTLYLADGAYTNFSALAKLEAVEVLDLSRVKLAQGAPAEIAGMTALRDLYLGSCGLEAFPECALKLPALRYLNLDRNRLRELPAGLPTSLRWLRLNYNEIANLPDGIGALAKLERIYLRNNKLEALPDAIASCEMLEDVELAGNNLAEFPASLAKLPRLRNLDLTGNSRITSLPGDDVLRGMKALRSLSLTGCKLAEPERDRIRAALDPACAIIF